MPEQAEQSPEARLYAAGFVRTLGFWKVPNGERILNLDDAIAALDAGEFPATWTVPVRTPGGQEVAEHARALEEREARTREANEAHENGGAPGPPEWLLRQAEVIAAVTVEMLKPVIRAEVRAALRAQARKQGS